MSKPTHRYLKTETSVLVKIPHQIINSEARSFLTTKRKVLPTGVFIHEKTIDSCYYNQAPITLRYRFIGIKATDIGRHIVANVTVKERFTEDHRHEVELIIKPEYGPAKKKILIAKYLQGSIPINHTNYCIKFVGVNERQS